MTSTAYKIKDVADRSGFTTATLRYYEDIGLLPAPSRTPAGYRVYDDTTLERLAFIARAKQLGCSLREIVDLATAWEGGQCGPIQDQLRTVVSTKLADAERQIGELVTLTGELRHAARVLEQHRPDGPCDDSCGCIGAPAVDADNDAAPRPIALIAKPTLAAEHTSETPIACTLTLDSYGTRVEDWQTLLQHTARCERLDGGIRVVFERTVPTDDLMRLVAAEHDCCQFLALAITVDTRGIALEATAPVDALDAVYSLFGTPA